MRRKDREITDREEISDILHRAEVCRIGMYDGKYPYVLPVNFVYSQADNAVFFHSAKQGRKIDILNGYPEVCVEIDEPGNTVDNGNPCDAGFSYVSLIARGRALPCTEEREKGKALELITEKYLGRKHSFSRAETASVAVYKISISALSAKGYRPS